VTLNESLFCVALAFASGLFPAGMYRASLLKFPSRNVGKKPTILALGKFAIASIKIVFHKENLNMVTKTLEYDHQLQNLTTNKSVDADTADQIYYYRARWFDPTIGQFLSDEPIEDAVTS